MIRSRKDLERLNEASLRQDVLIPLFRRMGYRDVVHYHGGEQELGKDIVMWLPDEILGRINFAVVAKSKQVTGRTSGHSSAAEVSTQIKQSLNEPLIDPTSSDQRYVNYCLVVSPYDIKKQAQRAILATLDQADRLRVRFIHGNLLWDLIEKHFPEIPAAAHLEAAQKAFETASEHHRITAHLRDGIIALSTQPKHPAAYEKEPLDFKIKFALPPTPEGDALREAFRRHVTTGAPVVIPGTVIEDFEPPDLLRAHLPKLPEVIELGARQLPNPVPATIVLVPNGADDPIRVEGVVFHATQVGTDEITLDNRHQDLFVRFSLRIEIAERRLNLRYSFPMAVPFAKRALEALRLQQAFASGGRLILLHSDSGMRFGAADIPPGLVAAPERDWIELLEEVALIQERVGVPIPIVDRDITAGEVREIFQWGRRVRTGKDQGTLDHVEVRLNRVAAARIVDDPGFLRAGEFVFTQEVEGHVLGTSIPVGTAVFICRDLAAEPSTIESIRHQLADPNSREIAGLFVPRLGTAKVSVYYLAWMPSDEADVLVQRLNSAEVQLDPPPE